MLFTGKWDWRERLEADDGCLENEVRMENESRRRRA